ncbi:MAG: sulfatase-like hydrolase/transferase [bacterium]|nr:sulfatase-like hydrolase/transferase [bacterium]
MRRALLLLLLLLPACSAGPVPDEPPNVLLITLDTTRADHLGAYGSTSIATPALDRLAAEGVRFDRAVTSVPLTLPAHASLMTGRWPVEHGVHDNGGYFVDESEATLAEGLRDAGYATFAAVGSFVLHHDWGLDQGFAAYSDEFETVGKRKSEALRAQRDGAEVVREAIEWWDGRPADRPFFVWMHFYDPHYPYEPPGEYARRYGKDSYAGEVAYTDSLVGRVIEYLEAQELYESTLIVVVADHGEGLGEHREPDHGIFLYEPTIRVPLIVRTPRGRQRGVVSALARGIDVMPTILDHVGVPVPDAVRGRSLMPLIRGDADAPRVAYAETMYSRFHYGWAELRSMRDERFKFIEAPEPELYDLEQDPGESFNAIALHPDRVAELRHALNELVDAEGANAAEPDTSGLDPETLERLRSLGYVGSVVAAEGSDLPDPKRRSGSLKMLSRVAHRVPQYLQEERFEEAIAEVQRAIASEPNYLDGYLLLAEAQRKLGAYDDAIASLEHALTLNPGGDVLRHELALSYVGKQDWQVALGLLQQLVADSPRYTRASVSLADVYVGLERFDDAVALLVELAEEYPDSAYVQYEIGSTYLRRRAFEPARRHIGRALEIEPRILGAHYNLALIAEATNDPQTAEEHYRREVEQFPAHLEAWVNLGILRMQLRRPIDAVEAFHQVVELKPAEYLGHFLLAQSHLASGRVDEDVLAMARRAAQLEPSPRTHGLVGEIERRMTR